MDVLDHIQKAINRALGEVALRIDADGRFLPASGDQPSAPARDEPSAKQDALSPGRRSLLQSLEQSAREADAELQGGEKALRRWLEASAAIARRLAK
jgi:hypothetical protein